MRTNHLQNQTFRLVLSGCVLLFSITLACAQSPATSDTRAADEKMLRDLDAQWSAAAGARDLDKVVSYYSEDATVMAPNAGSATTKETIRNVWKDDLANHNLTIGWKPTKVEVARSGDIACVSGTYEETKDGKLSDKGKYAEVWEKQTGGT